MAVRLYSGVLTLIVFSLISPNIALSQDNKFADIFAVVDGPYKLKSEIGIYGFVTQRSGEKVLFQPCTGEAQEISASEIEKTLNSCADGDGQSFASTCQDYYQTKDYAAAAFEKSPENLEIGNIYASSGGEIKIDGRKIGIFSSEIQKLQACNNDWSIAYDKHGKVVTQMLAIKPSLLKDSAEPIWQ